MPPTVSEAISRLDEAIPLSKAAAWDAVGLQVGDAAAPVHRVAVCHEATGEVVTAAVATGAGLLVAYHPLLFGSVTSFTAGTAAPGRAFALVTGGVALYVVHTAFDVAPDGCADALAATLDLEDVTGFGPNWPPDSAKVVTFVPAEVAAAVTAAMAGAGAGTIGDYTECAFTISGTGSYRPGNRASPLVGRPGELSREPEMRIEMNVPAVGVDAVVAALVAAHPYDEPAYDIYAARANAGFVGRVGQLPAETALRDLQHRIATSLHADVKRAGAADQSVQRVAVVPGSGSDLIAAAAATGADVLVTGDVSHHRAGEARGCGLAILDAGHAATERPGMARLYSLVAKMFDDVVDLTSFDPSPWEAPEWRS